PRPATAAAASWARRPRRWAQRESRRARRRAHLGGRGSSGSSWSLSSRADGGASGAKLRRRALPVVYAPLIGSPEQNLNRTLGRDDAGVPKWLKRPRRAWPPPREPAPGGP